MADDFLDDFIGRLIDSQFDPPVRKPSMRSLADQRKLFREAQNEQSERYVDFGKPLHQGHRKPNGHVPLPIEHIDEARHIPPPKWDELAKTPCDPIGDMRIWAFEVDKHRPATPFEEIMLRAGFRP